MTVAVKPGDSGITAITDGVAISDDGLIAFPGNVALGSQVFLYRPAANTVQTFGLSPSSSRSYGGAGISSGEFPLIIAREQATGPAYVVRLWDTAVGGLPTILGSSVTGSGPKDFDSATSFVDLSNDKVAVVAANNIGSTNTILMVGKTRPLPVLATLPTVVAIRPQIADGGEVVIRDGTGRIMTWAFSPALVPVATVIASSAGGFGSDTGNRPGISRDGSVIAFSGNRGAGSGIYLYVRPTPPVAPFLAPIAGGELADGFSNFVSESRVGVAKLAASGNYGVVFQARLDGSDGVFCRTVIFDPVGGRAFPRKAVRIASVGDALDGSTITGFGLHRPINARGEIAFNARLADGRTVVATTSLLQASLHKLNDDTEVLPEIEPTNLRISISGSPASVLAVLPQVRKQVRLQVFGPPNNDIRFYITPDGPSGGHGTHSIPGDLTRPHGWLSLDPPPANFPPFGPPSGTVESGGTLKYSSPDAADTIIQTTDANGRAWVVYTAPEIGGDETIWFEALTAARAVQSAGSVTMHVRIPDLVELPESTDIALVGHDKPGIKHTSSHWCTPAMVTSLQRLAQNYRVAGSRGLVPNNKLAVNDLSLPNGGFFDVRGDWTLKGGHVGHRFGLEADMGGASGLGLVYGNLGFERVVDDHGGFHRLNEGDGASPHYHLVRTGPGNVAIRLLHEPVATWVTPTILNVSIPIENCGGVPASKVAITDLHIYGGATLLSPLPIVTGGVPIRSIGDLAQHFDILVAVGPTTSIFTIEVVGYAESPEAPAISPIPSDPREPFFVRSVMVPPGSIPRPAAAATNSSGGGWQLSLDNPNAPVVAGGTVVYSGTITNTTGADIFFDFEDPQFLMAAPKSSHTFKYAPELLLTGGRIGPGGYTGPLFVVHWITAPPIASTGAGTFSLRGVSGSGLPSVSAGFTVEYEPQSLSIESVGDNLVLSWKATATGMLLEWTPNLDGEVTWERVDQPVQVIDGSNLVIIPRPTSATYFFRLRSDYGE